MASTPLTRRQLLQLGAGAAAAGLAPRPDQQTMTSQQGPLTTRGLFLHVWDLRDEGVDRVLGWMQESGLNQMAIAGSYHSGWFVHPARKSVGCT